MYENSWQTLLKFGMKVGKHIKFCIKYMDFFSTFHMGIGSIFLSISKITLKKSYMYT